jgi:hypothetical protein
MDQEAIDKVVAELRTKFPEGAYDLVAIDARAGLFVLRNPAHNEHMLYKKMILDESQQAIASHNLFVATCVYPEPSLVQAALKRFPGLLMHDKVQKAFRFLSGQSDTLEGKS